jgi:hypothetical protein
MITVEPCPDGGAALRLTARRALVYLDQWAIYKFAIEPVLWTMILDSGFDAA